MGKLRALSGRDACKILEKHGFREVRRRGSHVVMQRRTDAGTVTVPFLTTRSSPSAHSFRSSGRAASPAQNSNPNSQSICSTPNRLPRVNEDWLRFRIVPIPPLSPRLLSQLRKMVVKQGKPYQSLIHELLEKAANKAA